MASMPVLPIAFRYLRARHSHNAVNVITFVSMAGIAVAVAAMVVVLSIFNGFGDLAAANMAVLDAPLRVSPRSGGAIADADSLCRVIAARVSGVTAVPVEVPASIANLIRASEAEKRLSAKRLSAFTTAQGMKL